VTAPATPTTTATPAAPAAAEKTTAATKTEAKAPVTEETKKAPATPAATDTKPAPTETDAVKLGDDAEIETGEVPALGDEATEETTDGDAGDAETKDDAEGDDDAIEYSFEPPDGQPAYGEKLIESYKAALQKHKVPADTARDLLQTMMPALQADFDTRFQAGVEAKTTEWRQELEQRHGNRLKDVMASANRALAKAASPDLRTFLRDSALAVNPDFIDMLSFFGQRVGNDRPPGKGGAMSRQELSAAEELAAQYDQAEAQRG
jgi:hypothetical protein